MDHRYHLCSIPAVSWLMLVTSTGTLLPNRSTNVQPTSSPVVVEKAVRPSKNLEDGMYWCPLFIQNSVAWQNREIHACTQLQRTTCLSGIPSMKCQGNSAPRKQPAFHDAQCVCGKKEPMESVPTTTTIGTLTFSPVKETLHVDKSCTRSSISASQSLLRMLQLDPQEPGR